MKIYALIVLSFFTMSAHSYDSGYMQLDFGLLGGGAKFKILDNQYGWSLGVNGYRNNFTSLTSSQDRKTGEFISEELDVISISRIFALQYRWGFIDFGTGLGVGRGEWKENCGEKVRNGFLGETQRCDKVEGTRIGVPIQGSIAFGRYVGIGLSFDAFAHLDGGNASFSMSIPLGYFTKR